MGGEIDLLETSFSPERALPGSAVVVEVQWRVIKSPSRELTTFVHLGDPTQAPVSQGDSPALDGQYPTGLWAAGEVIDDYYVLDLPADLQPGSYPIHIGFYDPGSGERLPAEVGGQQQVHDAYPIGKLTVEEE